MNAEEFGEELYRENLYFVYEDKCRELEKELDKFRPFTSAYEMKKEIKRLNNIIEKQGIKDKPDYYVNGLIGCIRERDEEIERLNNIIKTKDEGIKALTEDLCEESIKIEKAIKKLNKYRNRKDTWGLWCMEYGDNAEVIKILGGEVRND